MCGFFEHISHVSKSHVSPYGLWQLHSKTAFWTRVCSVMTNFQLISDFSVTCKMWPPCFSESSSLKRKVRWLFSDHPQDANLAGAHAGVTHSLFIGVPDVSRCPWEANLRPRGKSLFKERRVWLIVLFLSGSPCSLESPWTEQPERKCAECNEGRSILPLFLSHCLAL